MQTTVPLLFHALLFRLIYSQSTVSPSAYVGAVPDYPKYEADASGVYTAIDLSPTKAVTDPCGPSAQPIPNPAGNTCNVAVLESTNPESYAVQCLNDNTNTNLNYTACSLETIPAICDKLADPTVQNATWIWASATSPDVCSMGFYLPPFAGRAQKPDRDQCVDDIFRPMLGYCNPAPGYGTTAGMYDMGMVNVKVKPDGIQNGQAVDVGYPSYIMATKELTA